jgi:hypothetical protein
MTAYGGICPSGIRLVFVTAVKIRYKDICT